MNKKLRLVLSTPLLFINIFKKTKIDNFVGGLIVGALFSLLVNIVSIQVQEVIQKQRILEALENEIATNALAANNVLEVNRKAVENKEEPNP